MSRIFIEASFHDTALYNLVVERATAAYLRWIATIGHQKRVARFSLSTNYHTPGVPATRSSSAWIQRVRFFRVEKVGLYLEKNIISF